MTSARHIFIALGAVFLWVVGWYHATAADILDVWWRSETFAHGLLVLPMFAWLVWRNRDRLAGEVLAPFPLMSVPILLAGCMWVLGELASVASVAHVALALLLVFSLVGVLGVRVARTLAFPILFLFFGVPIGEFLLPVMMKYTALFTVAAVRMSGVPVYQEGLHFVVPNGRWSVVEACSGVRYLIASLMVGTLYAYLSYRTLRRRLLFVACAVVVPIVANWLRAYMIVMIGYLSDNHLATGVDHLLYGWLFFGIVIMLMFWIGGRWREDLEPPAPTSNPERAEAVEPTLAALAMRVAPIALAVALWPPVLGLLTQAEASRPVEEAQIPVLPLAAGWSELDVPPANFKPSFRGFRSEVLRNATDGHNQVSVYVAVYSHQSSGRELVYSSNQLLAPSDNQWSRLSEGKGPESGAGTWLRSVLSGSDKHIVVWSAYWIGGHLVTSDYLAKALLAFEKLMGRSDTSAYVALWAVGLDEKSAADKLDAFQQVNGKALLTMLSGIEAQK